MEGSSRTIDPVEATADFSAGGLTLADVLVRVDTAAGIAPSRRRDLISAVHRVSTLLDRPPAAIPADPARLRPLLEGLCAARAKVSAQTWANLRSCLAAALRLAAAQPASIRRIPISPDWSAVLNLLPDRHSRFGLSRLARFCSAAGIAPAEVDEAVLERFATHLRTETLCKRPNDLIRRTGVLWNRAVQQVPGWPGRKLTVPSFRAPRRSLPLDQLPSSFRQDAEHYLNWTGGADPFGDHVPPHVCKPRTLRLRRKQIELMVSTLIERGYSLEDLRTLADLVAVENVKVILRAYIGNRPDQISAFTRGLAKTLLHIAKHWVRVPPEHLEHLRDLFRRLGPERFGLTEKNRTALRQFDDPKALPRLLMLPQHLMTKARRRGPGGRRAAVEAQLAVAIEILLSTAIRMNNLIGLRIGEHLVRPGGPKAPFHLILRADETKNGDPIEFPLSAECSRLIDTYVRDFRPAVSGPTDPWLFTTRPGKLKDQSTLALQLRTTIWREAGIRMSPHQFRHLAAKVLLAHDPANFEATRRLLAHKNSRTTINFYSGMQTGAAAVHYDRLLQGHRQRAVPARPVRLRRRP